MNDPKTTLWELCHEDEIWTVDGQYVGTTENPDYPENSSLALHIVNMHNTQIDAAQVQPFCYDTLISELRGVGG